MLKMERKRADNLFSDNLYPNKKRKVLGDHKNVDKYCLESNIELHVDVPNDTLAGISYLKSIFPEKAFKDLAPCIILKHQIYCVVKNKTLVDRQLNDLWKEKKVLLFKLITGSDEFAVVLTTDFMKHVKKKYKSDNSDILDDFLSNILPECVDVSISKQCLIEEHKYTENEITILVNHGLLQCRDVESWWFGIPGAGVFMKYFTRGRHQILRMIKRKKFKEILKRDLEKYKTPSKLGIMYHIYDIIGAEFVKCIESTSGDILRLLT